MIQLRRARSSRYPKNLRLLPNVLTTLALSAGINAVRFATEGHWKKSVCALLAAAILDVLDGQSARILHAQSRFGAELDSLSDIVCFGIAPSMLLYLWTLHSAGPVGWIATLAFGICAALRLARYNVTAADANLDGMSKTFFVGVPTPAAAGIAILPLIADFQFGPTFIGHPYMLAAWIIMTAILMVSELPTLAIVGVRIRPRSQLVTLALIGVGAGVAFELPWASLIVIGVGYICSLPLFAKAHRQALAAKEAPPLQI